MTTTLDYYNQHAGTFVAGTLDVEFSATQNKFLALLPEHGCILDFGCGSGRDTKFFIEKGFSVDATDGSEELCRMASEYSGIQVKHMLFSELDETEKYDGIWACSSILHLPKDELADVFARMIIAVKSGGYIYTSFKYGDFAGYRKGRFFTDFTVESFDEFISDYPELHIVEEWVSADVRPGRGDEKWLNLILRKSDKV